MTREEAERLMAGYLAMSRATNAVGDLSTLSSEEDRKQVAFAVGKVIATIYEEGMRPIIRQFPDLDPDLGRKP